MGYRSLKKILGEKNLERKCFVLFGIALVVLLGGGFWFVASVAENRALTTTNSKAREHVRAAIYDIHWRSWEIDKEYLGARQRLVKELLPPGFDKRVLSVDFPEGSFNWAPDYLLLRPSEAEGAVVRDLKQQYQERLAEQAKPRAPNVKDPLKGDVTEEEITEARPIFATRITHKQDTLAYDYNYYQAVSWKESCVDCHSALYRASLGQASLDFTRETLPFMVVKVSIPYDETSNDINWTRAILLAVAIVTVVVSLLALWIIVRYVVVKPLNHLRDVSDAVTRGHIEQRAEIQTGDEFEELANSFNKMLRHLVETQAEIRDINQNLDAKVDELAQLNMRLYDMNRMKSEFLAGMSHELRTPLNSIIGFSEVLQGIESLTEKQRRYVQNIQKSGRQLLDMINEILDLAKLEAGRMELRLTEFQLDRVIQAQCDMVRPLTEEKNLDLIVNVSSDLPPLYQDQGKIQQILTNLLSNAIKFTPEGGRITVSARSMPQGMIEILVEDTGVGIAESDREIIFEKFRQGAMVLGRDALTREFSGTGLGLSIVKELCKRLGGEVTVESELGKGSSFRVTIPWMVMEAGKPSSPLLTKLDDLTRPARGEFESPDATSTEAAAS